jgi:PAS domain S-box-containing protein
MIGGTISARWAKYATAAMSILTVILIALAEANGYLRGADLYSVTARASIYIFFALAVVLLQNVYAINTRELLLRSRKSQAQYQSLLENIPAITYINSIGKNAQTEYVSPQVEKMLGYPCTAFTDDPLFWTRILHPEDMQNVVNESDRTAETGEPFNMQYRVISKDKRVVWLRDEARLAHDMDGNPLYWLGIWTNISTQPGRGHDAAHHPITDRGGGRTRGDVHIGY